MSDELLLLICFNLFQVTHMLAANQMKVFRMTDVAHNSLSDLTQPRPTSPTLTFGSVMMMIESQNTR